MASLCRAARNIWIATDRWPDAHDLGTWARDAFRIEKARTPEEKAVALYRWTLVCMGRNGPAPREGERGREGYLMDTLKYLAVYGGHYCDGLSRVMINAWQAAGCGRGRKVVICRLGHTVAELRWRDADGRTRWHVFDPQHGWYVHSRDGGHIASVAEIDAEPELLLSPADPPRPWFYAKSRHDRYLSRENSTRDPAFGRSPTPRHRMNIDLRRGERWTRRWAPGTQYWPYAMGAEPLAISHVWVEKDLRGGGIADNFLGEHVGPYLFPTPRKTWLLHPDERTRRCRMPGTVELRYRVPLAAGGFREGAESAEGVLSEARTSREGASVHPARRQELAQLVYAVRTPYVITDAWIEATVRTGRDRLDMVGFYVSTDAGSSWEQVWGNHFAQEGRLSARPRRVRADFGAEAYHADRFSAVGRYEYLVRVDLLSRGEPGSVGLDELTIATDCQCGMLSLPALQPGRNRVRVSAGKPPAGGARLKLDYQWTERGRGARRLTKLLPASGGTVNVRVGGRRPGDVRMKAVSLELL
ncbi:MAG TPA: hypothetical protein PK280_09510 [Planctomycetota bacterium]|nr:hypothetical protein [Planctomycetota bacterium]